MRKSENRNKKNEEKKPKDITKFFQNSIYSTDKQ